MQEKYRRIRAGEPGIRLIAGSAEERLLGLDPLFGLAKGFSVLDIGCHQGTVLRELAQRGATVLHGVDLHAPSLAIAAERLQAPAVALKQVDLSEGIVGLRRELPLLKTYDVVLYLGIYHHMARQMSAGDLSAFVTELFPLARRYLAIRSPERFLDALKREPIMQRFRLIHRHEGLRVSPVEIYEPIG